MSVNNMSRRVQHAAYKGVSQLVISSGKKKYRTYKYNGLK